MNTMKIEIRYLLNSSKDWSILSLTCEEYFEEYEDIKEYSIDDIPKHDLAHGYLNISPKDISHLVLSISENEKLKEHSYTFWNHGDNFVINIKDQDFNVVEEQIIVSNLLEKEPNKTEVLRFRKMNGSLIPTYHSIIIDQPNGEQEEVLFDTSNLKESFREKILV